MIYMFNGPLKSSKIYIDTVPNRWSRIYLKIHSESENSAWPETGCSEIRAHQGLSMRNRHLGRSNSLNWRATRMQHLRDSKAHLENPK